MNQDSDSIQVGYDITSENPVLGIIHSNERKKVTINIRNESSQDIEITFGIVGGFVDNDLVLKKEKSLNQVVGIYENYEIGEEITLTDGSKWHVLENSDPTMKNITLLSDYNLKPDGSYDTGCGKTINETYQCSIRSFDSTGNNGYDENDSNNIGYFLNKTYLPKIQKILDDSSITVSLPTLEQFEQIENQKYNYGQTGTAIPVYTPWLLTTNYWLKTKHSVTEQALWAVQGDIQSLVAHLAIGSSYFGVRPTITLSKEHILNTMDSTTNLEVGTSVVAIDGSKWHVLEKSSSGNSFVTLLSDYNLKPDGSYNTQCGIHISGQHGCSPMAFDSNNSSTYHEDDSHNIGYFIKNVYAPIVSSQLLQTTNITLPTAEQIASIENKVFINDVEQVLHFDHSNTDWFLTTYYWTKTPRLDYPGQVWIVYSYYQQLATANSSDSTANGARPVITTLKSNLFMNSDSI